MGVLAPESASKNFKVTFWDGLFQVERAGELNYSTSPHRASWGLMSSDILQERLSIGVPCGGGRTLFPPICNIQCNMDCPPHSTLILSHHMYQLCSVHMNNIPLSTLKSLYTTSFVSETVFTHKCTTGSTCFLKVGLLFLKLCTQNVKHPIYPAKWNTAFKTHSYG